MKLRQEPGVLVLHEPVFTNAMVVDDSIASIKRRHVVEFS